jgi:hypothetical protein
VLGVAETKLGIGILRTVASVGRLADRGLADLRLAWDLPPQDESPADGVQMMLRVHNEGGKPVTVEQLGLLYLDRALNSVNDSPHARVREASWSKRLPEPKRLERGGPAATVCFSVEELARAGFSLHCGSFGVIAISSDGRVRLGRVRHSTVFPQHVRKGLTLAEERGQAAPGAIPIRWRATIRSPKGHDQAVKRLRRLIRAANRQRQSDRAR